MSWFKLRRGCRACQGDKETKQWVPVDNGQTLLLPATCEACEGRGYNELSLLGAIINLPRSLYALVRYRKGIREGMQAWAENINGKNSGLTQTVSRPRRNDS